MVDDVVLIDEHEAVETELFLAGSGGVLSMALVDQFILNFAHVAGPYLDKGNATTFVERKLLFGTLGVALLLNMRLFFGLWVLVDGLH